MEARTTPAPDTGQAQAAPGRPLRILAYLKEPERSSMAFERLAIRHAGVEVRVATTPAEAEIETADALVTIGNHLGADAGVLFSRARSLKWVQSFGTGVDNIKGHPQLPPGVVVTNVHGVHGPQLSEAAFAAMLGFARHVPAMVRNQDAARWEKPASRLLHGATVGIVGLGAIASELAPRCKAFGMRVIGITRTVRDLPHFDAVRSSAMLAAAVADLDFLVLLTPHTPDTHHMIGAEVFRALPAHAVLVNLSRGGVVDEAALLSALDAGEIAGAALDVFEVEPLPATSPFWRHPKVMVTPHSAGFHTGYPDQAFAVVAENVGRFLSGGAAALLNKV